MGEHCLVDVKIIPTRLGVHPRVPGPSLVCSSLALAVQSSSQGRTLLSEVEPMAKGAELAVGSFLLALGTGVAERQAVLVTSE